MSSLLRHPAIVPSLFSDGLDGDLRSSVEASLPRRVLALVVHGLSVLRHNRGAEWGQRGSAIAVVGLALWANGGLLAQVVGALADGGALR